jgi:hypothetical protein
MSRHFPYHDTLMLCSVLPLGQCCSGVNWLSQLVSRTMSGLEKKSQQYAEKDPFGVLRPHIDELNDADRHVTSPPATSLAWACALVMQVLHLLEVVAELCCLFHLFS